MSLFSRSSDLPGLQGVIRDCSSQGKGLRRLAAGDIAVVDAPDIERALVQRLISARPAAIINTECFSTGAIPNYGPQLLVDAGIMLVENVGADIWRTFKDGKKARLTDDGELFFGDKFVAAGNVVDEESVEEIFSDAQQSLVDHMEAFFGNSIQFIHSEAPLLIDGIGIPDTGVDFKGEKALVLSPGKGHRSQLKLLRNFIREYDPVLVGVDEAADTLVEMGYEPDLIVGNPSGISTEALRSGAKVVLPADPDGHAAGLERIQDLGIGAMTFPAASNSATDLALLLADYHGATLIVNAGAPLDLGMVFVDHPEATPSALLSRSKIGNKLIDATTLSELYNVRPFNSLTWLWAVVAFVVLAAVVVSIAGTTGDGTFIENLTTTWHNIALTIRRLFRG